MLSIMEKSKGAIGNLYFYKKLNKNEVNIFNKNIKLNMEY